MRMHACVWFMFTWLQEAATTNSNKILKTSGAQEPVCKATKEEGRKGVRTQVSTTEPTASFLASHQMFSFDVLPSTLSLASTGTY